MDYYINKEKNTLIGFDGANICEFTRIVGEETEAPVKRTYNKKIKMSDKLAALDKRSLMAGKAKKKITPEVINKIKEQINLGTPVSEIAEEFGVPAGNIYYYKKSMAERAADTIPG